MQGELVTRNENVREICEGLGLGNPKLDVLNQFHHVVWLGDLNYRLNFGEQVSSTRERCLARVCFGTLTAWFRYV